MRGVRVRLLAVCLFLDLVPVAWIQVARADDSGWDPRVVRALTRLEQLPSGSCRARWLEDGRSTKGWLRWGETLSTTTNQARLDEWQSAAPGRHLPRLGETVRVLNRYDTGKPLSGTYLGFDGPLLVLGQLDGRPDLQLEWKDLQALDPADRPLSGLRGAPEDWPPSRRPLLELTDLDPRPLDPRQIERLRLLDRDPGGLLFVGVPLVVVVVIRGGLELLFD